MGVCPGGARVCACVCVCVRVYVRARVCVYAPARVCACVWWLWCGGCVCSVVGMCGDDVERLLAELRAVYKLHAEALERERAARRERRRLGERRHELAERLYGLGVGSSALARELGVSQGTADRLVHGRRRAERAARADSDK